jgi:hypothetical protein
MKTIVFERKMTLEGTVTRSELNFRIFQLHYSSTIKPLIAMTATVRLEPEDKSDHAFDASLMRPTDNIRTAVGAKSR